MSYEGYVQVLCANGHYNTYDAYDDPFGVYDEPESIPTCKVCGENLVWRNGVDETNGCEARGGGDCLMELSKEEIEKCRGCGYVDLVEKTPAKYCQCKECGHTHMIEEPTYYIPEKKSQFQY
jgi:ribosomal protein S27E